MSITISTDVFCDRCGEWTKGTVGGKPERRNARARAKRAGWMFVRGLDLCPNCEVDDE